MLAVQKTLFSLPLVPLLTFIVTKNRSHLINSDHPQTKELHKARGASLFFIFSKFIMMLWRAQQHEIFYNINTQCRYTSLKACCLLHAAVCRNFIASTNPTFHASPTDTIKHKKRTTTKCDSPLQIQILDYAFSLASIASISSASFLGSLSPNLA